MSSELVTEIARVVEGETEPLIIPLYEDEAPLSGTGLTVSDVALTGNDTIPVDTAGKFAWSVQADGTVAYSPAAGDFAAGKSPYRIRVKLTDGSGKVRWYPNQGRAEIKVLGVRG